MIRRGEVGGDEQNEVPGHLMEVGKGQAAFHGMSFCLSALNQQIRGWAELKQREVQTPT